MVSPIRAWCQQVKSYRPQLSRVELAWLLQNFSKPRSNPSFLSFDSIALGAAIHSVTHLDLARSDELRPHLNDSTQPAAAGPENVQCPVVFIQFLRTLVLQSRRTESNPSLTHDAVESL